MTEHSTADGSDLEPEDPTSRWLRRDLTTEELARASEDSLGENGKWSFPQPLTRRIVLRSVFALILAWPTVPWIVHEVASPIYRRATLEQMDPIPEARQAQRLLVYLHPFWMTVIGELLVLGVWAYICVPDFFKLYQFNKFK